MLMLPAPTFAQGSGGSGFSDEEAKALAVALAELEGRRREVEALRATLRIRDERLDGLTRLLADQERLTALWKEAATARREANDADGRIKESYAESVKKYEDEVARVRAERDSARRQRWIFGFGGAVLGAVIAILAADR
jgi:hypothetical protein